MVAILLENIKNVVKKVPNPHLAKFPLLTDVLKKMDISEDITKLPVDSIFCDNIIEYEKYYPVVGKKRIYKIQQSVVENGVLRARVKVVGVILIQNIHAQQKIIMKYKKDDKKSEKVTVVTGCFGENYIKKFPQTLFFNSNKIKNFHWRLGNTSLFSIDMEKIKHLEQVIARKNCEFKVS